MIRSAKALLYVVPMGCLMYAQTPQARPAQTPAPAAAEDNNKAGAYYNFAMGRLYAELAASEGNKNDYVNKAIQHYKEALKLDPSSPIIFEELTDLYIQTNHLADAVAQAEELLKQNPDNLDARRMLGRIYTRMIPDNQPGRIDEKNVRNAIEQFQKITQKEPKDAESWVMLGRLYRVSNNSPEAEKAYNAALDADPTNEDALTGLASLYADLGDSKRAIEKLKVVAEKAPSERTLGVLAEQYEQLNDYKDAAEVLKKLQEVAPDNPKIGRALARDLMYSEQLDDSLKLFQQFVAEEPRDWESQLSIAEIYQAKKDLPKAREAMEKAKTAAPDNLEVRYQDARLLSEEGKSAEALAGLKSMLDDTRRRSYSEGESRARSRILDEYGIQARKAGKNDEAVDAFRQLSALGGEYGPRGAVQVLETYRQAKDLTTARKEADAALKKYPDDRMVKMEHAAILADQGKVDEAAVEIRAIKGDHERESLLTLAQMYEKAKRYNDMGKALDDAEKLAKSDDDKETIYFMRGAMYERQKKFDASETEFRKVLKINPDNAEALNYLGYMLADRAVRLDEAYGLIKKAIDQDPNNGPFLDSLGWVYFRQGKLEEAEQMLTRALEKIGQDPTVHDHLGDVYSKLGKTREAAAQWQASLKAFQEASSNDADADEMAKVTKKLDDARVKLAKEKK
jgi:tetratricopeptide (TPR) repeat protein